MLRTISLFLFCDVKMWAFLWQFKFTPFCEDNKSVWNLRMLNSSYHSRLGFLIQLPSKKRPLTSKLHVLRMYFIYTQNTQNKRGFYVFMNCLYICQDQMIRWTHLTFYNPFYRDILKLEHIATCVEIQPSNSNLHWWWTKLGSFSHKTRVFLRRLQNVSLFDKT